MPGVDLEALIRGYYRHVPRRTCSTARARRLRGRRELHHSTGRRTGRRARPRCGVFTPTLEEHGWPRGRTVVEVVTDDMPFLVDSRHDGLIAQRAARPAGHPPPVRGPPRRRPATLRRSDDDRRRSRRAHDLGPRVLDAPRDRAQSPTPPSTELLEQTLRRCCTTCARRSRTGRRCTAASRDVAELDDRPAAVREDEVERGARAARPGWPTSTSPSSATASTTSPGTGDDRCSRAVPGHRARHPARRPEQSPSTRQAAARGRGQGAGEASC